MRVTESRMIAVSAEGIQKSQQQASVAGTQLSTGKRVEHPHQDAAAWADGLRAHAQLIGSQARGRAIGRATDLLDATDGAYGRVGEALARAYELSIQMANGTMSSDERGDAVAEVDGLFNEMVSAANTRANDGEYVLGGDASGAAPFTSAGLFVGNASQRAVEVSESGTDVVTISGSPLTAASGVDVFAEMQSFRAALASDNQTAIQASVVALNAAIHQVAKARTQVGTYASALHSFDSARSELEQRLAEIKAKAVDADPTQSATDFATAKSNLQAAQAVAEQIVQMTRVR